MASATAQRTDVTARRPGPVARLAVFVVVALAAGLGARLGAWWVPFLAGAAAGAASGGLPGIGRRQPGAPPSRVRGVVLPAVFGAVAGWAVSLWVLALRGLPAGATARAIAALAGLPPHAAVTVAVTLLLAALQALAGAWLTRAFAPRR
jgi:hypothetical protein